MNGEVKQFKLVTGEEIVCEVLEWPDRDDETDGELVIRRPLKIIAYEPQLGGTRMYLFRPWMILQGGKDQFQTLADFQIVGEANPSQHLMNQYVLACQQELFGSDSDESATEDNAEELTPSDSDQGPRNIIRFPGRTIH